MNTAEGCLQLPSCFIASMDMKGHQSERFRNQTGIEATGNQLLNQLLETVVNMGGITDNTASRETYSKSEVADGNFIWTVA